MKKAESRITTEIQQSQYITRSMNVDEVLPLNKGEELISTRIQNGALIINVERSVQLDAIIPIPSGEDLVDESVEYGIIERMTTKEGKTRKV